MLPGKRTACSSYHRLSKSTFLALLGPKPTALSSEESAILAYYNLGLSVAQIAENTGLTNKQVRDMINEVTLPRYSSDPVRAYFEKLEESSWSILSFDPVSRETCVRVSDKTMSVTLPQTLK